MKGYKQIFSSFHALYRLTTSFTKIEEFAMGIAKVYVHTFKADTVILVCKSFNSSKLLKVKFYNKKWSIKRGGLSILTEREKKIIEGEEEILLEHRLISPFIFLDTLGAIYVKNRRTPFTEMEKRLFVALTEQMGISLKLVSLFIEEKKNVLTYIKAFSQLLTQHVPTSYIHYKRLSKLIKELAKDMHLTETERKSLEFASLLHDVGKINLPMNILKKQEPLTEEEFRMIMKHPRKGVELIKDLKILKPVIPIILHHHERYDGRGYPSKLKKEEIPLAARILAVLDAFDAMFFGRPYKRKMSLEEIERELKKQKGIQFDPRVVEAFLNILKKKRIRKYLNSLE
ncbi:MAG: hypothetical protein DRP68_03120 [Candidatus Omnitrophota bacterium]|nr:MAG: hypothetical protein DRP68_03120 [Candidatus Omnitrophota bacterium]RKY45824.1 MAG: hypothetical protein DRP81_02715 [Candidatus Omnitrophota bacterium]HDN85817.1 HD domain-containing protein [Candidatus Omnitrophota bacterium]